MENKEINLPENDILASSNTLKTFLQTLLTEVKDRQNARMPHVAGLSLITSAYVKIENSIINTEETDVMAAIYINDKKVFMATCNSKEENYEQKLYQGLIHGMLGLNLLNDFNSENRV
jgi:hypothetical protein